MSLVQPPPVPERKPNAGQFGSNNPFRNRASQIPPFPTAAPLTPASPTTQQPQSRNPFLDVFGDDEDLLEPPSRMVHKSNSFDASSTQRPFLTGAAADLFENLTITDHDRELKAQMNQNNVGANRDVMKLPIPPGQLLGFKGRPPPPVPAGHRHSKSSDNRSPQNLPFMAEKSRPPPSGNRLSPPTTQRQRRNSDSSIMDAQEIDREKAKERDRRERKAREARRAAGEPGNSRDKDGRRPSKNNSSRGKKGSPLDIIDKLDVTGIYGSGLFHHDGPFDACNPHRNKNNRRAPMEAFPADSANQSLTGFGPMPEKGDHSKVYGNRDAEAYNDFSMSAGRHGSSDDVLKKPGNLRSTSFDPVARVEPVHGDETLGLGSSTFLDGAPASKKAILQQIEEAQQAEALGEKGGLGRKKSLSHKLPGFSRSKGRFTADTTSRRRGSEDGVPPPDTRFSPTTPSTVPRKKSENNPFLGDYDAAYDRKGESIGTDSGMGKDRAPSSPKRVSAIPPPQSSEGGGGLMKRVRSLSKSKKRSDA
ncbi:Pal1 cell morphology protein-domain-containing protein [Tirmania nivea]|nr:Pal1 cell morphology protein-domain-containing protein [Tirmania nivea]